MNIVSKLSGFFCLGRPSTQESKAGETKASPQARVSDAKPDLTAELSSQRLAQVQASDTPVVGRAPEQAGFIEKKDEFVFGLLAFINAR